MEVRHGFQEARAAVPRIMGSAMLVGSGLALELHLGQSYIASEPSRCYNQKRGIAENPKEGSGPPRASRQEATPTPGPVVLSKRVEEGKDSSHKLGLRVEDGGG